MKTSDKIKYKILNRIFDSRFSSKLDSSDWVTINSIRTEDKGLFHDEKSIPIKDIELNEISLVEVFHLNDFDKIRKAILNLLKSARAETMSFSEFDKGKIENNFSDFSTTFDKAQSGKLFRLNFKKFKEDHNLPYNYISIEYWKTFESFIVLVFKISPSLEFKTKFRKICSTKDKGYSSPNFLKWSQIPQKGRFIKSQSIHSSLKHELLDDLIDQICSPFEKFLARRMQGVFSTSKNSLPKLIKIKIKDKSELIKDSVTSRWLNYIDNSTTFMYENLWIAHTSNTSNSFDNSFISIIETSASTISSIEYGKLRKSLCFLWAIEKYLDFKQEETKILKRRIYDFASAFKVKRWPIVKAISQKKYLDLKLRISQDKIIYSIFSAEFKPKLKFNMYIGESNLQLYQNHIIYNEENGIPLHIYKIDRITKKADKNSADVELLDERFRPIEKLNEFSTTASLEKISIIIGFVALLLASDKIIVVLNLIYEWTSNTVK